jgi:protein kinase
MDKYTSAKVIGDGTYGSVLKAVDSTTGAVVAIKRMKKKYYKWEACICQKEIQSLIKLSHPNIVSLHEVCLERSYLHFVFEFLDQNVY